MMPEKNEKQWKMKQSLYCNHLYITLQDDIMTIVDEYIITCIKNNKKPSGRKLHSFKEKGFKNSFSETELYSIAKNVEIPLCSTCNLKRVELRSVKMGFGKYCSKNCYKIALSKRNSETNKILNSQKAIKQKQNYINKNKEHILTAIEEYKNDQYSSIKVLSKKYNLKQNYVREELEKRNLLDSTRQKKVFLKNLNEKMSSVNAFLTDTDWVLDKQDIGYTTKMIADELGCSQNYVSCITRKLGIPFQNNKIRSSHELILSEYLLAQGYSIKNNDRSILEGKEIDIFFEDYNLGIEINGVFWHQYIDDKSDKNYHIKKTELAKNKGINLIHVYDFEITDERKLDIIKSIIDNKCGKNKKIYARSCEIKEINSNDYKNFLDQNHLKGSINSKIKIGLFYDCELVVS